jgi:hypothetical protein
VRRRRLPLGCKHHAPVGCDKRNAAILSSLTDRTPRRPLFNRWHTTVVIKARTNIKLGIRAASLSNFFASFVLNFHRALMDQERKTLEQREHVWGGNIYLNTGGRYYAQFAMPTPTPTPTATATPTSTATPTASPTPTPRLSPTPRASPYPSTTPVASCSR